MTWPFNEMVTVTYTLYDFDKVTPGTCVKKEGAEAIYYAKNKVLYTKETPWPYNNDNICANYI